MKSAAYCFFLIAGLSVASAVMAQDLRVSGKFVSVTASGPPLEVFSTDLVPNLNAELLGGKSAAAFQPKLAQTIVISPTGDAQADGMNLANTVNSISGANQSNPVLVWIEPGTYTLSQTLVVPAHVHVQGAGQGATRITRTGDVGTFSFAVVVLGASTSLKELTVLAFGGGSERITGVKFGEAGEARIHRVTVEVQNGGEFSRGVEADYSDTGSSTLVISEVTVSADGGERALGIRAPFEAALDIRDSRVSATGGSLVSGGVEARGAESRLTNTRVTSDDTGVLSDAAALIVRNCDIFGQNTGAAGDMDVYDSRVEGVDSRALTSTGGGTTRAISSHLVGTVVATCVAVTDGNFAFHAASCP